MRILLADDHRWFHSVLQLYFEQEPELAIVGDAYTVDTLLQMAPDLEPDLILLDWTLPGINTQYTREALLTYLHSIRPCLYIIILSIDPNVSCDNLCRDLDTCVSMAEPPERLLNAIHWAQQQHRQCRETN